MREDVQEALEKLLPDGYLTLYACGKDLRMSRFNPHAYTMLPQYMDEMLRFRNEMEGKDAPVLLSQLIHVINDTVPDTEKVFRIRKLIEGE